jgi:hypothetical protein
MRTNQVPRVVLAAALSASALESELLNSERIAHRFGSYGLEMLSAEPGLRRSNLYSREETGHVCRTYAVVQFADQIDSEISEEHAKVLAGSSIGAIFKSNGSQVVKETLFVGGIGVASSASDIGRLMHLESPQSLAMHVYRLILRKGSQAVDYATVIESHHPAYLTQEDLYQMYPTDSFSMLGSDEVSELAELVLLSDQKTPPCN